MNIIEKIITDSLDRITKLNGSSSDCKVIFPRYKNKEIRYSEQELKSIFLEKLTGYYYSCETPTKNVYRFVNDDPLFIDGEKWEENKKKIDVKYQSANIDVSIYNDKETLLSHIEFKYGQVKSSKEFEHSAFPIQKDLLKLICEDNNAGTNYFVHYLVTKDDKETTKIKVLEKYYDAMAAISSKQKENIIKIRKYNERKTKVKVFVLLINKKTEYRYSFSLEDAEKGMYFEYDKKWDNKKRYSLNLNFNVSKE